MLLQSDIPYKKGKWSPIEMEEVQKALGKASSLGGAVMEQVTSTDWGIFMPGVFHAPLDKAVSDST